jgi:outer membrane murein-binding lipoprotein Lpp
MIFLLAAIFIALVVIIAALVFIIFKINKMEEMLQRLDAATNEIASDMKALRDQIASGQNATPEQLQRLDANITRLEGLGQDPQDPVPDPEV